MLLFSLLTQIKDKYHVNSFSGAILYFLKVPTLTRLSKHDRCPHPLTVTFSLPQIPGALSGGGLVQAVASKPALYAQQLHRRLLHRLVHVPDLSLGQGPLHVAVRDAVAVAGLVCPGERKREAGE